MFCCFTLEDDAHDGAKVPGETAIPLGVYRVLVNYSQRFQTLMPLLIGVPGFTGIRIHAGNGPKDTAGCILVGLARVGAATIESSKAALNMLLPRIQKALQSEDVWITIEHAPTEEKRLA